MAVGNQPARLAAIHNVDGRHGLFFDNDLAGVAVGGSLARRRECELSSEPAIRAILQFPLLRVIINIINLTSQN